MGCSISYSARAAPVQSFLEVDGGAPSCDEKGATVQTSDSDTCPIRLPVIREFRPIGLSIVIGPLSSA